MFMLGLGFYISVEACAIPPEKTHSHDKIIDEAEAIVLAKVVSYEPFATGWWDGERVHGRPVDLQPLADGSLLVSDDAAGRIYRIRYLGVTQ